MSDFNPLWMFRCRPHEFRGCGHSLCPGIFWLNGWLSLCGLHVACFSAVFTHWFQHGYSYALQVPLMPLALLWLVLCSADIKFRLQRPTRAERNGFDDAVLNWFGFVAVMVSYTLLLPGAALYYLWRWLV